MCIIGKEEEEGKSSAWGLLALQHRAGILV